MDISVTPQLRLQFTGNQVVDDNLRRIDYCFYAKANALPFPTRKLASLFYTPTIGLAYTSHADENLSLIHI